MIKAEKHERSGNNERNHLHQAWRLFYPRFDVAGRTRNSARQIRPDAQGLTEELKEKAPTKWVGLMNNIRNQAEEVILNELIYC